MNNSIPNLFDISNINDVPMAYQYCLNWERAMSQFGCKVNAIKMTYEHLLKSLRPFSKYDGIIQLRIHNLSGN